MNEIKLNDNYEIPQIGYGTWKIDQKNAKQNILEAFKVGYRHFDTAQIYNNEYEIGLALSELPRYEIFLTTKVWVSNYNSEHDFLTSIKQSLKRLNVKSVNLLLLHWPIKGKNVDAYRWLEKAKDLGYTTSIGVSNFMINHLKEILAIARYKPVVNQIEIQPLVQQKELVKFCKANQIAITGYSNLRFYLENKMSPSENRVLENVAKEVNKSVSEVILRWVYQEGIIIIPKSSNIKRMKLNISIHDFELNLNQINQIRALDHDNYSKADAIYDTQTLDQNSLMFKTLNLKNLLFDKHFDLRF